MFCPAIITLSVLYCITVSQSVTTNYLALIAFVRAVRQERKWLWFFDISAALQRPLPQRSAGGVASGVSGPRFVPRAGQLPGGEPASGTPWSYQRPTAGTGDTDWGCIHRTASLLLPVGPAESTFLGVGVILWYCWHCLTPVYAGMHMPSVCEWYIYSVTLYYCIIMELKYRFLVFKGKGIGQDFSQQANLHSWIPLESHFDYWSICLLFRLTN